MRTTTILCGMLLFLGLMHGLSGSPMPNQELAGICSEENKEWNVGQCERCICRNKEVLCENNCG